MKNTIANVMQEGRFLKAITLEGNDVSNQIDRSIRRAAIESNCQVQYDSVTKRWYLSNAAVDDTTEVVATAPEDLEQDTVREFIHKSTNLKPRGLIMSDLKWKYLVRSALRGKNIMMVGAAGSGKTLAAKYLVTALQRPDFYFNLGATQDPRATLIGNTHFNKESGTYFAESLFVKAIQTENAVILLDELSRAHPEAWNILMTVLDANQRYLRLDEKDGAPTIKVAPGVSFIATANVGNEFTATRKMDRALEDRFITIEMDTLSKELEFNLLKMKFPLAPEQTLAAIAEISSTTRTEVKAASPKLTNSISTRVAEEVASLICDGFSLAESAEVAIYPFFSEDGGVDSERTYVKQIVQKFCVDEAAAAASPFNDADAVPQS